MIADELLANDLSFSDIEIGQSFELAKSFSAAEVLQFALLSGDQSPLHVDEAYAKTTEFQQRVVHGMLLASLFSNLVGMKIPGKPALYLGQDLAFRKPVFIGDRLVASAKVTGKNTVTRTLVLKTEIRNTEGQVVVSGTAKVKIRGKIPLTEESGPRAHAVAPAAENGAVAVITGGSRGIGTTIARALARKGYVCAINYRSNESAAHQSVAKISQDGGKGIAVQADITQEEDLDRLVATVVERVGSPSVLVNAAIGDLEQHSAADVQWVEFEKHINTQIRGVLGLSQRLYPLMKDRGGGSIINVLSQVVSNAPPAGMADYVTAKYALMGLSKALATEWAADKIRVNMVSPGLARTDLTQHYHERLFKMEASRTPLGRLVDTGDIASVVCFLAGDEAAFLTGINLFLTGGQVMP